MPIARSCDDERAHRGGRPDDRTEPDHRRASDEPGRRDRPARPRPTPADRRRRRRVHRRHGREHPRVAPRGGRRPGRARHADRPRGLGARRRAGRARRATRRRPLAKKAGDVTADASGKLAERSRALGRRGPRAAMRHDGRGRRRRATPTADRDRRRQGRRRRRRRRRRPGRRADGRPRPRPSTRSATERGPLDYTPPMSVRPIVLLGDPRLRLKGLPVDSFGKYLHELLDDLAHTMRDAPGVGLAAPQLGEALQACVIEVESQLHELVNPRIVRGERRRPRPRGLPLDPGLRRLRDPARAGLGRRPEPARAEDQGRRHRGCSAARSSTSSTTSTASSTSTTSSRWTS